MLTIEEIVKQAREQTVSDIHLTAGKPAMFRIHGELKKIDGLSDDEVTNRLMLSMLTAEQVEVFNKGVDVDFVFEIDGVGRQRVNIFRNMGKIACSIRLLNSTVKTTWELGLPKVIDDFAAKRNGLILVTGTTGSGKTTTLSAVIEHININRACHIITIEDPVEYRYEEKKAVIHQREIGSDVPDFNTALRSAMREDPDVIFVGEMRDYETIQLAVTAAETGHLVLATLHTKGAADTISRIVDACPPSIQSQMLVQLSQLLEGVVSQVLMPTSDGMGRVPAFEILVATDGIQNMIRTNKCHQLEGIMQTGQKEGMCLLDDSIYELYRKSYITRQTALDFANDKAAIGAKMGG